MPEVVERHVLVLNRHWLAVHVCTVRRAVTLLYQGFARAVTEDYQTHDFESWCGLSPADRAAAYRSGGNGNGRARGNGNGETEPLVIRTPNFDLPIPQVIVLHYYARNPPKSVRFNRRNIYLRDRHQCQYCGAMPGHQELTIDHVLPRSRGGLSQWENVVAACAICNSKKGARLTSECGMHPRSKPRRPSWLATLRLARGERECASWARFVDSKLWKTSHVG